MRTLASCAERIRVRATVQETPDAPYVGLEHIGVGTLALRSTGAFRSMRGPCMRFLAGDVLVGRLRPYFRKVVQPTFDGVCSPEIWVLRARTGVDPTYLRYWLAAPDFIDACTRTSEGTRMPRAKWDAVCNFTRALPPLAKQQHIAFVLGALDRRIEVLSQMNGTLQQLLQALYGDLNVTAQQPLGEVADRIREPIQPIHHRTRAHPWVRGTTPYLSLAHLTPRQVALDTWGQAKSATSTTCAFSSGDVLFGRLRPVFGKVVLAPFDGVCSADILVLRATEPVCWGFLLAAASSADVIDFATRVATGTRMPRTSWATLANYPIPKPTVSQMRLFHRRTAPMLRRLSLNVREARHLATLRDALLLPALRGALPQRTADPTGREQPSQR